MGLCQGCEVGGKGLGQVCGMERRLVSRSFHCWIGRSHGTGEVSALPLPVPRWG